MEEEKKDVKKQQDTKATEKIEKKGTKPKQVEKANGEKKKSNNGIAVGIVAIIVLVVVAILIGMFAMKDSPKKVVETMLSDLKSGNYSQELLDNVFEGENFDQEAQKLFFDKLEWKILNVKEEGDKATVELEITNKDFKTIIGNCMQKILKVAFTGGNISEEETTKYLVEELNNSEIQNVTSTQSIILQKQDGKWQISEENDFVNILLPGFNEAISTFQ